MNNKMRRRNQEKKKDRARKQAEQTAVGREYYAPNKIGRPVSIPDYVPREDVVTRIAGALDALVALGQQPEYLGSEGHSPVHWLAYMVDQFGSDLVADQLKSQVCRSIGNSVQGSVGPGGTLVVSQLFTNDIPFNLHIDGPGNSEFAAFVTAANELLYRRGLQPVRGVASFS